MQANTGMFVAPLNESRAQLDGAVPDGLEKIETTLWHSPTAAVNDLICTHDFDGRILSVNGTACQALGVPTAELSRLTIQEQKPFNVADLLEMMVDLDAGGSD